MSNSDTNFERVDDSHADAEGLAKRYHLQGTELLADILPWLDKRNYDAPGDQDSSGGRPWAEGIEDVVRLIAMATDDLHHYEFDTFDGIVDLACANVLGIDAVSELSAALAVRVEPIGRTDVLPGSPAMADLLIRPLADFWRLYSPVRDTVGFACFVGDALRGRWDLSGDVLRDAISKHAASECFS